MELDTEQRRIINQVRKHVSPALANEIFDFFIGGKSPEDLRGIIAIAAEERHEERRAVRDANAAY
jgi:hypothetical protein